MKYIKFRTWDKTTSMWADHNRQLSEVPVGASVVPPSILAVGDEERYELNLFTGLKDKNGKGIYEGDIVTYPDGEVSSTESGQEFYEFVNKGVIEWDIEWARFNVTNRESVGLEEFFEDIGNVEVIGNIYENADLI